MEIKVAKKAGFCFGVDNAVKMILSIPLDGQKKVYTLGQVIHNDQMTCFLENRGIIKIEDISEAVKPAIIVLRAHGEGPYVYKEIADSGFEMIDATCPYVKKVHRLVEEKYKEGYRIIIIGDSTHPEVKGINGWCNGSADIVYTKEEAYAISDDGRKTCIVAQTTIVHEKYREITEILGNTFNYSEKFDTICKETELRQTEAEKLAESADLIVVVGGRNSSNTRKLYETCKKHCCNTLWIESSGELPTIDYSKIRTAGVTAGASTPDWIIEEVLRKMTIESNGREGEMTFSEAIEGSLVTLRSGDVVKGKIISFSNTEVFVDLGYKSDGIIPMQEYSDDPLFKPDDSIKPGDIINVLIIRVNDGEGNVLLSKKKVDSLNSILDVEKSFNDKTPLGVVISEVTKGGLIAVYKGTRIFIPASQAGIRFVKDLNQYVGQNVKIMIIEFDRQKRRIIGSQRALLEEEKQKLAGSFWDTVEIGRQYEGVVKSLTDFGAFVDIGGVDGLVHLSELSWSKIKHPSEVLNAGDKVTVNIIDFDREKKRISLGYRRNEDNPWIKADEKYKLGDVIKGTVTRIVPFGAFIEIQKGIDGLVHISHISQKRVTKPDELLHIGQEVFAKIIEINTAARKINLSIKEADIVEQSAETSLTETSEPMSPKTIPLVKIETAPEVTPETAPEVTPETAPETTPETAPETAPETTPETAPETTPETAPEVTPETAPETAPEVTPETAPETAPEVAPETAPEVTPEVAPETAPETAPEVTPEIVQEAQHENNV